jgi:limonene 1,2-monooxygenase
MQLAGKYGIGVLSIASNSSDGIAALPTQWGFAEESAAQHGQVVDRKDWRVLMAWHLAETKEQARREAVHGLHRWHNEYNVDILGRPGANRVDDPWELLDQVTAGGAQGAGAAVVGTPDELVTAVRHLQQLTGGFGVVLGFAHDWANREATLRSWDLVARYVIPELNAYVRPMQASADYVAANKADLMAGATAAVMNKIMAHQGAAQAMAVTMTQMAEAAAAAAERGEQRTDTTFRPGAGLADAHQASATDADA